MRNSHRTTSIWWKFPLFLFTFPVWLVTWPFVRTANAVDSAFLSYLTSRVMRDRDRIYSIKFVWYSDSVYLHPMIWGSLILYFVASAGTASTSWLLLYWFIGLLVCFVTVMYNFNVLRTAMLAIGVVALLGVAYISTIELSWNPLAELANHIAGLAADVTPGFYLASAYFFGALIVSEVIWAWLFHRVEIDEAYIYEHKFLWGTTREPIFARALRREIKDLLELVLLGAADIEHRTRNGTKRFKNVPLASLWLGSAIDLLLDHRRPEQVALERKIRDEEAEQARLDDAFHRGHDWEEIEMEEEDVTVP